MHQDIEKIQKLLGRERHTEIFPVRSMVEGKVVMVTGAGGSIGSVLCLQLIAMKPKVLILYEMSEFALYQIDNLVKECDGCIKVVPVLGNLMVWTELQKLMDVYKVDVIYHAAAYKHVPMVERNPIMGIENNVRGTKNLVDAARSVGVCNFVLVSTDKAVNPTNVMGASKRLAEYIALVGEHPYKVVRFGNVLWSNGSVLPLFYSQLATGKELTITDPEVSRYFMSIKEAVDLILQSSFVEGSICVLDMGEPVKILDMAMRLADLLKVKEPTVKYIGLRPGEKLHEELTLGDCLQETKHPNIKVANEEMPSYEVLSGWLRQLNKLCERRDIGGIRTLFGEIIPGYESSCGIVDDVWVEENVFQADNVLDDCYLVEGRA